MRLLRRLGTALALGFDRARHGGGSASLVVVGVAAAAALLAVVLLGSAAAERRTLAHAVERLAPPERTVRASWFGIPAQAEPLGGLDGAARSALAPIAGRPATRTVLFRESTVGGSFVALGAVDGLDRWLRLTAGRLPRSCEPSRCEVVQLRGRARLPDGFVVVGRGRLRSTALFGDAIPADRTELERAHLAPVLERTTRYHRPAAPPLLLGGDVAALVALDALGSTYRTYGWVLELAGGDVAPWDVGAFLGGVGRARAALQARSVGFEVAAPVEEVRNAGERARIGARRLLLLGGQGAALLLAFSAFAAIRMRRPAREAERRLALLGVPFWQRAVALGAHAATLALLGVAAVWVCVPALAALADPELARTALLGRESLVAALVLAAAAAVAFVVAVAAPPPSLSRRFGALDALALALLAALAAALTRGGTDAPALLGGGGVGAFLLLLPAAAVALAALVACRVLVPLVRWAERRVPRRSLAPRLAALSLARRPGAGAAAVAFLVVGVGLAVFASTYRATLERGQRAQAAFALGADFVLREDLRRLVPVREVATESRLARFGPGIHAAPVVRLGANVPSVGDLTGIAVLGLEPGLLRSLRGADLVPPELAVPSELAGPRLPARSATLEVAGRASPATVTLAAVVRGRGGAYEEVALTVPGRATLPRSVRGGTFLGFRVLPPPRLQERGADAGRPFVAELRLGALTSGGATVVDAYDAWLGVGGASFHDGRLDVTLTDQVDTWFRPRQALDGVSLPALVSPRLAALADDGGRVTLQVGGRRVEIRVAAVARRFPSTRGDFAVVDRDALEAALNLAAPGSGFPTEVWANAAGSAAERSADRQLRREPFDRLVLDSRSARERELRDDPLARGALAMLALAAGAALLLALLAVALTTLSDVRDDSDELLELEAQGASPALLRRVLRLRQLAVAVVGVAGGVVAGAALTALVTDVVAVSAAAAAPVPPLEPAFAPLSTTAVLAAVAAVAAAFVLVATRRPFRGDPARPAEADA